ncbi:DeoR/GlpR family DNA-binding transcription regulator [Thalassobacillus pellis]|uniref:DeoR/GlpR family DNA-binding transcription regulator n=1 Tax=Thalassobacillus pellis TaxID=748008 RepID=UPI001961BED2|nr:DeoR/GlpR family DNA-binding transcription regulator [Thalassobacillus pellis]MBM7551323.1 DeoR family fructose operon transcriptional repressor [Thalassobacillus pellis]
MLTPERHQLILDLLYEKKAINIQELVAETAASESTIRRDLSQLESDGKLRRVHGGASIKSSASEEPSMIEKTKKHHREKLAIAKYAASLVRDGDSVFLDAGSTTYEMIPFLSGKEIVVVTNGINHIDALTDNYINTYTIGGHIKATTRAVIGAHAVESLKQYRFEKSFLGINGVHPEEGYTTPDPEEAIVKRTALQLSGESFVLADASKFNEITFSKVAAIEQAGIITNAAGTALEQLKEYTEIKVVDT